MAKVCGLSESHFRRVFEESMNMKPVDYVNMIRKRAFGELEDGKSDELTTKYVQYYRNYAADRSLGMAWEIDHFDNYPIPFGSNMADYVPGEDYYDMVKEYINKFISSEYFDKIVLIPEKAPNATPVVISTGFSAFL